MSSESRLRIGVLTRTHGLAGGVRCMLDADSVPAAIAVPCDAWVGFSESFLQMARLERCELRSNDLICFFAGAATPDAAAKYVDRALFLPTEAVSYGNPLSHPSLMGYAVRGEAGEPLGEIAAIFKTPAHYIWLVRDGEREWMVPAIDQFVCEVRHAERTAIVRPIPGMVVEEPEDDGRAA